jgi:hypothetical protein
VTPLRQHRPFSSNPTQQAILSRQSTAATAIYSGRDDGRRSAGSVKLWLIRGMVQVSERCFWYIVSYRSPSIFYLLTVRVEVVYCHLITLRQTPNSVGLLWTRDRPVSGTST